MTVDSIVPAAIRDSDAVDDGSTVDPLSVDRPSGSSIPGTAGSQCESLR